MRQLVDAGWGSTSPIFSQPFGISRWQKLGGSKLDIGFMNDKCLNQFETLS